MPLKNRYAIFAAVAARDPFHFLFYLSEKLHNIFIRLIIIAITFHLNLQNHPSFFQIAFTLPPASLIPSSPTVRPVLNTDGFL
jgi:hypothetical protein